MFNKVSDHHLPLAIERGVKGAAFAAWEEIEATLLGTESVAGVNEGDSTFKIFLSLQRCFLPMLASDLQDIFVHRKGSRRERKFSNTTRQIWSVCMKGFL